MDTFTVSTRGIILDQTFWSSKAFEEGHYFDPLFFLGQPSNCIQMCSFGPFLEIRPELYIGIILKMIIM